VEWRWRRQPEWAGGKRGAKLGPRRDTDGGESEKGARRRAVVFIGAVGDRGRRGRGVWGGVRVEERDGQREGGPGTAVGGWHRPVADGHGRAAHARVVRCRAGEVGSLTHGPEATVTGGVV
jgi:hypothetical protein